MRFLHLPLPARRTTPLERALLFVFFLAFAINLRAETIAEVRNLPFSEIASGREVQLSGTVTYLRDIPTDFNFYLNDSSGGVMVYPLERANLKLGQRVFLKGITGMSVHGLLVRKAALQLGPAGQLPEPLKTTMAEVREGHHEGQYAEMEGVIRSLRLESPELQPRRMALDFGSRARRLTVWISNYPEGNTPFELGATVRVRGVVVRWKNPRGQPQSINVLLNSTEEVLAITAPLKPQFEGIDKTQLWDGAEEPARSAEITGTITFLSEGLLVVQQGTQAMRIRLNDSNLFPNPTGPQQLGNTVRLRGFPVLGTYTVELEDAHIQESTPPVAVRPESLPNAAAIFASPQLVDRDARLITLPARVLSVREREAHWTLELLSENKPFTAILPHAAPPPKEIRAGSRVQLTGICTLHLSEERRRLGKSPDSFTLMMRIPEDLTLLAAAPWWTPKRLQSALLFAALGSLLLLLSTLMLRARNRRLRLEIDARQRAEAELANERRRVAGQLHDTLQQTITAASLQLHAASKLLLNDPPSAASSIDLAHQLIVRSREELRDAVWDLRVDDKARVNLHELLSRLCQEFSESHQTRITFAGDTNTHLPAHLATQIVRVTREATTNALKHASASSIQVQLTSVDSTLTLTIKDNGRGFNLDRAPGPETGHFGLSGMKESLERIGGSIVVKSTLGAGTVVKLKIQTV